MRARGGRPEEEYEGEEWEGGYGRGEFGRKHGRRESPPHGRSRRHRWLPAQAHIACGACLMPCVLLASLLGGNLTLRREAGTTGNPSHISADST